MEILGHKRQIELLEKAMHNGKLSHAYVFAGPDGVGKKLVAKKLATQMLEIHGDFHPDYIELGEEGIKIEQIRELTYKLSLKPYQAKYKIALINNAEQMTSEAANALLKTLEEPKSYTYLFLITSNPNRLPKTILSRCQKITFGPVELEPQPTESDMQAQEFYTAFMNAQLPEKLILAYDIADLDTEEIKTVFDFWLKALQAKLHESASKLLAKKISAVMIARKYLDQNVNSKLLLTNLMLNS